MSRPLYGSPNARVMLDISPEEGWADLREERSDAEFPYTLALIHI